jgi:hypothetical protein
MVTRNGRHHAAGSATVGQAGRRKVQNVKLNQAPHGSRSTRIRPTRIDVHWQG